MSQGAFAPVWFKDEAEILSSQTAVIHQIPIADFRSINYILTFFNLLNNTTKSINIAVIKETTINWYVNGKLGTMAITVSPTEVSGNLNISVTNNESYTVQVEYAFATLGEA